MRRPMVVGNWKMYTSATDANILATTVRNYAVHIDGVEIVLCPPSIWLTEVAMIVGRGGKIQVGAQNAYFETEGPYTGEISPMMIRDVARYVIIGHSERRQYFGETDLDVNEKVQAALKAGLSPIVCVGEKKKTVRGTDEAMTQLEKALEHIQKKYYSQIIVAYEPIWAIGTGENADPEYVAKVATGLRAIIGSESAILYGGSVKSGNVKPYSQRPEIDGLLVGGASLRASEFIKICSIWSQGKTFKKDVNVEGK